MRGVRYCDGSRELGLGTRPAHGRPPLCMGVLARHCGASLAEYSVG